MGIRYYAYPVAPEDTYRAKENPAQFIGADPLADAWGLVPLGPHHSAMGAKPRPEMLYLDKCWPLLQRLTHQSPGEVRPAYRLFEGDVDAWAIGGYEPYVKALTPEELARVADDLETVTESDVEALFQRDDFFPREGDRDYLLEYLDEAKRFAVELRERGFGLVYTIG